MYTIPTVFLRTLAPRETVTFVSLRPSMNSEARGATKVTELVGPVVMCYTARLKIEQYTDVSLRLYCKCYKSQ